MPDLIPISVTVNGTRYERSVEPRLLLSDFLRHELGLTGTHVGCEHGSCGACTILLDGEAVRSCILFAVQANGREVTTVEGLGTPEQLHPLQEAFREKHALQCGYCTPGFLMTLIPFLAENPQPTEAQVRDAISGNICRCTGYQNIVEAVILAASSRESEANPMATRYFGQPIKRNEDPRLLTGQATFTDDVHLTGMLHAAFVRSDYAHARIKRIDTSAALAMPGVVAIYTAADLGAYWQPGPLLVPPPPVKDLVFNPRTQVPLAKDKIRHAGEPIAVVVAETRYQAEDAAEQVFVEVEMLPAVVDIEHALDPARAARPRRPAAEPQRPRHPAQGRLRESAEAGRRPDQTPLCLRPRHRRRHGKPRHRRQLGPARPGADDLGYHPGPHPHPQRARRHARPLRKTGARDRPLYRRRLWPQDHDVLPRRGADPLDRHAPPPPRQVDRGPRGELLRHHPGARPGP